MPCIFIYTYIYVSFYFPYMIDANMQVHAVGQVVMVVFTINLLEEEEPIIAQTVEGGVAKTNEDVSGRRNLVEKIIAVHATRTLLTLSTTLSLTLQTISNRSKLCPVF